MSALLAAGADINARDDAGNSALDYARRRDEPAKIALLVAHPFTSLRPSSLDLLACAITMHVTRGGEQRDVEAAIETPLESGVGVSFIDSGELWFARYSLGPIALQQVSRTDDAIATARTQRLANNLDALRWPGALPDDAVDRALAMVESFTPTLGSTAIYQPRQTLLQRKALRLLEDKQFTSALACITDDKLVAPMIEARALAGLTRFDEAVAVLDRMPPTAEINRLKAEWRKPTGLTVGSAVSHTKFGRGTILALEGTKARVRFADQERTLATSFLQPA